MCERETGRGETAAVGKQDALSSQVAHVGGVQGLVRSGNSTVSVVKHDQQPCTQGIRTSSTCSTASPPERCQHVHVTLYGWSTGRICRHMYGARTWPSIGVRAGSDKVPAPSCAAHECTAVSPHPMKK